MSPRRTDSGWPAGEPNHNSPSGLRRGSVAGMTKTGAVAGDGPGGMESRAGRPGRVMQSAAGHRPTPQSSDLDGDHNVNVDRRREAAQRLRDLAATVPAGPWVLYPDLFDVGRGAILSTSPDTMGWESLVTDVHDGAIGLANVAPYVAGMHPGVALAVADLLERSSGPEVDRIAEAVLASAASSGGAAGAVGGSGSPAAPLTGGVR
jgi:hypothetical protein